jgi:hypothetical protein
MRGSPLGDSQDDSSGAGGRTPWKSQTFGLGFEKISEMQVFALTSSRSPRETLDLFLSREATKRSLFATHSGDAFSG